MFNKRGQVAIFVIIALVVVGGIILFFVVSGDRRTTTSIGSDFTPEQFLQSCIRESLSETIDTMISHGGFVEPTNYILYEGAQVAYHCSTTSYYEPCVVQYPSLVTQLEEEIHTNIEEDVETCYILLEDELDSRGYSASIGSGSADVSIVPDEVRVIVDKEVSYSQEQSQTLSSAQIRLATPLYDITQVITRISNAEAEKCTFDYVTFMKNYPRWDIQRWTLSDASKVYTITDADSDVSMRIATRGCAIPAGL